MSSVFCYFHYGLGGYSLSSGTNDFVRAGIERAFIPGVICRPCASHSAWHETARDIRVQRARNPAARFMVMGHSLGAVTATYVTDSDAVDVLALYDIAGGAPSPLARNTRLCLDFYDAAFDIVPEWRPVMRPGYENRLRTYRGNMGHVQCVFNPHWLGILIGEIRRLAAL